VAETNKILQILNVTHFFASKLSVGVDTEQPGRNLVVRTGFSLQMQLIEKAFFDLFEKRLT
jgi:hypothetical protein